MGKINYSTARINYLLSIVEELGGSIDTVRQWMEEAQQAAETAVGALDAAFVVENVSGAMVSFDDGADDVPVKNVSVGINAVQAGGTPTPSSPIPIVGFDGATITRAGKNLVEGKFTNGSSNGVTYAVQADGSVETSGTSTSTSVRRSSAIAVTPGETYFLCGCPKTDTTHYRFDFRDNTNSVISGSPYDNGYGAIYTIPEGVTEVCIGIRINSAINTDGRVFKPTLVLANSVIIGSDMFPGLSEAAGYFNDDGSVNISGSSITNFKHTDTYIPVSVGENYAVNFSPSYGGRIRVCEYDANQVFLQQSNISSSFSAGSNYTYSWGIHPNTKYIRFSYPNNTEIHLWKIGAFTLWFPDDAGVVYGGTLDVASKKLTVNKAKVSLASLNWTYAQSANPPIVYRFNSIGIRSTAKSPPDNNTIADIACNVYRACVTEGDDTYRNYDCSITLSANGGLYVRDDTYTTTDDFKAGLESMGAELIYELITPVEYDLTTQEMITITSLLGDNTMLADCGDIDVDYRADTKMYIDKQIASI